MDEVYCWGYNSVGNLGDGTTTNSLTPTRVQLPSRNGDSIVQLSSGQNFNCVLIDNGTAFCWGSNDYGQVEGDLSNHLPNTVSTPAFVNITESGQLSSIDVGTHHTCAVLVNSDVKCWGRSTGHVPRSSERISTGLNLINQTSASKLLYPQGWGVESANLTALPVGFTYTFPRLDVAHQAASVNSLSWSITTKQSVVQGMLPIDWTVLDIHNGKSEQWNNGIDYLTADSSLPMIDVETGTRHACGLNSEGIMYCWGNNDYGKLGDGSQSRKVSPSLVRFADTSTSIVKMGLGTTTPVLFRSKEECFAGGTTI